LRPSLATRTRALLGVSASRGSSRHVALHQPRSHGPGAGRLSPPGSSRLATRTYKTHAPLVPPPFDERRPVTRALPQPDPLGHLLSRDRGAPEGESGAIRPPSPAAPERVRNERVRYASDDHAAWSLAGSRGPVRPAFAGPRSPAFTEPRGPRAASPAPPRRGSRSAAPEVPSIEEPPGPGHPAFARYRRSGGAFSTGCHQPVENARRRCQVSGWQTHAQARLP
jgi:hypothetical protein